MIETKKILEQLETETNLQNILQDNKSTYSTSDFSHKLYKTLEKKGYSSSYLIKNTQLSRSYIYKLLSGERSISRDKLLQITFAIECDLEETVDLIKYAGAPSLYAKKERDCIIIYAIIHHMTLHEADCLLLENKHKPLQDYY